MAVTRVELPKDWTSTRVREELTRLADDVARLLDPGRPALGEPEVTHESEGPDHYGEFSDTTARTWEGLLVVRDVTSGINDGATPTSDSLRGDALGLPPGCAVSFVAVHNSPVHVQPSWAEIEVHAPPSPAVDDRIASLGRPA